jgi:hypothetical protein
MKCKKVIPVRNMNSAMERTAGIDTGAINSPRASHRDLVFALLCFLWPLSE